MRSLPERKMARVIKAARLQQDGARVAPSSPAGALPPAEDASERILRVARQVARATLLAAQRDAAQVRQTAAREARQKAYAEGKTRGYQDGVAQAKEDAQRIVAEAQTQAQEIVEKSQADIGQLACEVAAHLLGQELRLNPEIVERTVMGILQEAMPGAAVCIEVSSSDYQRALAAAPAFRAALGSGGEVRVAEGAKLPPGGVRVIGPNGTVERNWQDGLLAISEAFEEVARRGL